VTGSVTDMQMKL